MTRNYDDDDDDSPFDENGVLKDGRSVRVSLMDATRARQQLHDGKGGQPGHRPGFAFTDTSVRDRREQAYQDYERDLCNSYLNVDAEDAKDAESYRAAALGSVCTVKGEEYPDDFGAPGHVRRVGGELVCVPDRQSASADDHALTMDEIYETYDRELRDSWRTR
jgi:hypothetical protein